MTAVIAGVPCCGAVFRRVGSEGAGQTCILAPGHGDHHVGIGDAREARDERRRLADALALAAPPGVGDDFDRVAELARIATDAHETDRLLVEAQARARELDEKYTMEWKRSMWARDTLVDALPRPKEPPIGGDLEHMIKRTVAELARRKTEVHDWRNRVGGLVMTMEVLLLQVRAIQAGLVESGSAPDPELDADIKMAEDALVAVRREP